MGWLEERFEGWPTRVGFAAGLDRATGAPVHLKTAVDPDAVQALERELWVAEHVSHDTLVAVVADGRVDGARAAAFAWVPGNALDASAGDLDAIAIDVLRGLLALHSSGVVHGDLKPDHVRVDQGRARLIDLGLAVGIGESPAGGTAGFVAPEYLAGGRASVVGDLFAFGRTFSPFAAEGTVLAMLCARACDADPAKRPASCEAALAILGARPSARDRHPDGALVGRDALLDAVAAATMPGRVVHVHAPPGSGATSFAYALARRLRGRPCARVDARDAARALALARENTAAVVIVDGAIPVDRAPACALVIVSDAPDASFALSPVSPRALAARHAASLSDADLAALVEACEGRAGRIVRALERLEADESLTVADAVAIAGGDDEADAARALERGAPRACLAILDRRWPRLDGDVPRSVRSLAGRASAESGDLARAVAVLESLDREEPLAPTDVLVLARCLERLGRADALAAMRDRSGLDEVASAEIAAMVAAALFTRGRLADARALAESVVLGPTIPAATSVRLACIASDAALRSGDAAAAEGLASRALALARTSAEPRPLAQAHARVAGVHAMAGRWVDARAGYADALAAAERANDRTALSPYLMNLAAAEHALFEVDAAIGHYERAIALARELGRAPSEAAALTNLGALLEMIGAPSEASPLLERAERVAESAGAPVALAQARMIHAEARAALGERERALSLVVRAQGAFAEHGVGRQSVECALLRAEIDLAAGDATAAAAFAGAHAGAAREAGLGARVALLEARVRERAGDVASAARVLEAALTEARRVGEREPSLRLLVALAAAHRRLATGAAPALEAEARSLRGSLALHVPPGLRDRFVARHALPEPEAPSRASRLEPASRAIASLLRRTLRATDETAVLEAAVDEAIALTHAERAFLLARRPGRPVVSVARNLDRETIKNSRFRFSRSVAERVLSTGEPLVTASASDDPELAGARSILDLGVRSILCVPIRGRADEVLHALYLDHRFERARFSDADLEIVEALADVIGLCLENARLHAAARTREQELVLAQESLRADAEAKALEVERLSRTLEARTAEPAAGIVGRSRALLSAVDLARRVAPSGLSVLIECESGTGKELIAKLVHAESPRRARPMLSVNCGALPEALLESELFGHVRGAFTGALRDQPGLFRAADGGTLFLDEIGEMPLAMQARLLRVLADGEVRPVGATRGMKVDVRIVAATNRDLAAEVQRGTFREDLFFRIAGVRVALPPLRERREDLAALCASILAALGERRPLAPDAMRALLSHPMPGNVRELEQALRRASIVADGDALRAVDLGLGGPTARAPRSREPTRAEVEAALAEHRGNRSRAATALGVHRTTVHRLVDKHGIDHAVRRGRPPLPR